MRFEGSRLVFVDSITPVVEAGQDYRWDGEHRIGDTLRLELAPGHTPGSSVLWLEDGDGAVFVGDLMHTPVQMARPNDACAFDLDADTARSTRCALPAAARSHVTLFPGHFAGHGALTIDVSGIEGFEMGEWAEFSAIWAPESNTATAPRGRCAKETLNHCAADAMIARGP